MKTEKQILKKWLQEEKRKEKMSEKHINSPESKFKGHVTNREHITGEKLSSTEGFIFALEWVLDKGFNWWDKQIK